jgi:hypothetical protein
MELTTEIFVVLSKNMSVIMLMFFMILMLLVLIRWQTDPNNNVQLQYLLVDTNTEKVSLYKLGQLFALAISSWVVIHETLNNRVTEWLLAVYMLIATGVNIAHRMTAAPGSSKPDVPGATK